MSTVEEHPASRAGAEAARRLAQRYERWRSWRWQLLGLLVAVQLAGLLSSPVRSDAEDFYADLAAGNVQSVQVRRYEVDPAVGYRWDPGSADNQQYTSLAGVRWVGRFGAVY